MVQRCLAQVRKLDDDWFAGKQGLREAHKHAQGVLEKGKDD